MDTDRYIVDGMHKLEGEVRVHGAKNAALPILAASLLCDECEIENCPDLSDIRAAQNILRHLGCKTWWESDSSGRRVLSVKAEGPFVWDIPDSLMREMRSSIVFLGAIISRCKQAKITYPGGCELGPRPIDLHLTGLARMGVQELDAGPGRLVLLAPSGLHGAEITLRFPSVGATETLLLAAACARGRTVLRGAAREPEVADLADFLNRCGGSVEGAGSSTLIIEGRRALGGCVFSPLPDRIFASTLACAAAAAGGRVELTGCSPELYAPVLEILAQMGCRVERGGESVQVARFGRLYGAGRVFTGVYPALATGGRHALCGGRKQY